METKALENGEVIDHPKGSLRWNAQRLLMLGEPVSVKEVADRLDGKVPQGVIGGDDDEPAIKTISKIELVGVRPSDQDT